MKSKDRVKLIADTETDKAFVIKGYEIEIEKKEVIDDMLYLWINVKYKGKKFSVSNPFIYPNPPTSVRKLGMIIKDPKSVFKQMISDSLDGTKSGKWVKKQVK